MSKLFTCSTNQKHASAVDKLPYNFGLHLKHFITKAKTKFKYVHVVMCNARGPIHKGKIQPLSNSCLRF